METILEQQRRYHEERERLMDAKTKEMLHKKSTVSWQLYASVSTIASQIMQTRNHTFQIRSFEDTLLLLLQLREQINSDHRTRAMLDVSKSFSRLTPAD